MKDGLRPTDSRGQPGHAEKTVMAVSTLLTLALFGLLLSQAVTGPQGPDLSVHVAGLEPVDGGVDVVVELRNDGNEGVRSATVAVDCGTPPPEVTLNHIAAGRSARAVLRCPPGTESPQATISAVVPR